MAVGTLDASRTIEALLLAGWISMPTVLSLSLVRPSIRRLVAVPAAMVTALIGICLWELRPPVSHERAGSRSRRGSSWAVGWAPGSGTDGSPSLEAFDDPYSTGRVTLIVAHVGLVVAGTALILLAWLV